MQLIKSLEGTAMINKDELKHYYAKEISLEYYMLEVENYNYDVNKQKLYGIEVVKTEVDRSNSVRTECEMIPDVSSDRETVKKILRKMAENKVTPICVMNVLEDIIGINN